MYQFLKRVNSKCILCNSKDIFSNDISRLVYLLHDQIIAHRVK